MKSTVNILIVEDQAKVSKVIRLTCEDCFEDKFDDRTINLETTLCFDGKEAIEKCRGQVFDLIISDINMPNMDGNEFIEKLRSEGQESIPIIVVSAYTEQLEQTDENLIYIMEKPFDVDRLSNIIKMALAERIREIS